jgi:nucleoside-diphosphate-sugar epimerase
MARILITGANGFTGRYLVDRLAPEGHELIALAHDAREQSSPLVARTLVADLRDLANLRAVIAEVRPDRVVHLAAIANVAHGEAADLYSANILGTRNLLHALCELDRVPDAVLLASSANIYGNQCEGVLTEDLPPAPANDYGVTKAVCELLAQVYADRLPIITVRPFNYTGRGQAEAFLIPKIVAHARRKAPWIELGNINIARDFSDVRAVVDAYARLLQTPAAIGQTLNVCSGQAHSLAQVLQLTGQISGHQLEIRVNPDLIRADEVQSLCGSRTRLESVIGTLAMPELSETIGWMLDA